MIILFEKETLFLMASLTASRHFVVEEDNSKNIVRFKFSTTVSKFARLSTFSGGNKELN